MSSNEKKDWKASYIRKAFRLVMCKVFEGSPEVIKANTEEVLRRIKKSRSLMDNWLRDGHSGFNPDSDTIDAIFGAYDPTLQTEFRLHKKNIWAQNHNLAPKPARTRATWSNDEVKALLARNGVDPDKALRSL